MPDDRAQAYTLELAEYLQASRKRFIEQVENNRMLLAQEHDPEVPAAYKATTKIVRTPVAADIRHRVAATITAEDPKISCPPNNETEKAQRNSSLRERWTTAAYERMQDEIGRPVNYMLFDGALADGLSVAKLIYRPEAWKGEPRRKKTTTKGTDDDGNEIEEVQEEDPKEFNGRVQDFRKTAPFPFVWNDIDVTTYFPLHDGMKLQEVLEISQRPLLPTARALGVRPSGDGWEKARLGEPMPEGSLTNGQTVPYIEHWDAKEVRYFLDGKLVKTVAHGYGRPPFFEISGYQTNRREPQYAHLSVIHPFRDLIPVLDRLLTMKTNWAYLLAWPLLVLDPTIANVWNGAPTPDAPKQPDSFVEIGAGRVVKGLKFMEPPGTARDLDQLIEMLRVFIDRSGLASVVYGSSSGISSGYMASQLLTAAQLAYKPILRSGRMAYQQMTQHMWRLIERKVRQAVYVWAGGEKRGERAWLALAPEDINAYYAVDVEIKPLLPMDEIAQRDSAQRMTNGKALWSVRHALEKMGEEAPEEITDEMLVEKVLENPQILERLSLDAARKAGLIEEPQPAPPPVGMPQLPPGMPTEANPMGASGPILPMQPGVNMPLVPPPPEGAGLPPQPQVSTPPLVQRRPGGPNG